MRLGGFGWALAAILTLSTSAAPPAVNAKAATDLPGYTTFNDIEVPPLKELDNKNFDSTIRNGYWFVKHYSPYCGHCLAIAPHWQTLYEYYYTSNPLEKSKALQTDGSTSAFHAFYDFHFASLNCVAFGDICKKQEVQGWPTFILYKDGKAIDRMSGEKSMEKFVQYVEEKLEQIKPGSRAREGVKVPKPGAKRVDRGAAPDVPVAKDKDPGAGIAAGEKQNEVAANQPTATTYALLAHETAKLGRPKKASKGGALPNSEGISQMLSAESFQKFVTTSQDPWFIKFYVPWCKHCQHLAPTWDQIGREMQGKLNIGEVNCETNRRLCNDARVDSYPTLYFFRGGERVEYEGLRGLGDLLSFTNKALDSDVKYVDKEAFEEMEETEEVIFTYFFDHATTSEDFAALDRLTLSLIGHAKIVKTDSQELANRFKISTWPRLLVVRDGRPNYYNALAPKDMRDFRKVLDWMKSVWLPIVPELTPQNSREIMNGKFTVLGILSRDRPDDFTQSKRELKNAALEWMDKITQQFQLERQELRDAKQLRIEEAEDRNDQRALRQAKSRVISITEENFRKPVRFAWVDGVFWERWLRSTYGVDVTKGERVIINDEENRRYWDVTDSGGFIVPSRTSILETLPRVVNDPPKLASKSTISTFENFFFQIRNFGTYHPYISIVLLVVAVIALISLLRNGGWLRKSLSRSNSGYFRLNDGGGLLGTPSNSKAD